MVCRTVICVLLVLVFGTLLACSQVADEGGEEGAESTSVFFGESSIEERIAKYPTVVRATLNYIDVEVIEGTGRWDDQFTNILKFNLTVHEYLNGSGGNTITAVWGSSRPHDSREAAMEVTTGLVAQRDTTFDDRESVIFLENETWDLFSKATGENVYFLNYKDELALDDGFSLFSKSNKLWLPLASPGMDTSGGGGSTSAEYLLALPTDMAPAVLPQVSETSTPAILPQTASSAPTISLTDLKAKIATINAELAVGNSTAAYRECVGIKYGYERMVAWGNSVGRDLSFRSPIRTPMQSIASGAPSGSAIYSDDMVGRYPDKRTSTWLEGGDSALFEVVYGPNRSYDLDNDGQILAGEDGIEYLQTLQTVRPLPAGEYTFDLKDLSYVVAECNHVITTPVTVTVTEVPDAVHEALFDPVTDGTAVAADSSNGQLEPATFTDANGASATIQRVEWASDTVKVKVSPHTGLAGQVMDFIELDGSVSLSLNVDDATVDDANNTLSWSVAEQPWHDGDKLMVRIREAR